MGEQWEQGDQLRGALDDSGLKWGLWQEMCRGFDKEV